MVVTPCGVKSHLPRQRKWTLHKKFIWFAEVSELADEQDSGSCERYAREGSSPFFRMITLEADVSGVFAFHFSQVYRSSQIISCISGDFRL